MRENGFEPPFNAMQVATWFLLPLLLAQFFLCISPVLPSLVASVVLSLVFGISGAAAGFFAYQVSKANPIDRRLKKKLQKQKEEEEQIINLSQNNDFRNSTMRADDGCEDKEDESDTKFCWICQTRVHTLSMHCKFCDKCVEHFDHHCQWLNTCVGAANYNNFFRTLCALAVFCLTHTAPSMYVVVAFLIEWVGRRKGDEGPSTHTAKTYDKMTTVYGGGGEFPLFVITLFFLIFVLLLAILILQLCVFHVALQKKKITTYEYIVRDNALKREKAKKRREVFDMREMRVMEERRNGRVLRAYYLMAGRFCLPACDPIQRDMRSKKNESDIQARGGPSPGSENDRASEKNDKKAEESDTVPVPSANEQNDTAVDEVENGIRKD